ncbi:MAG: helix-turn-helix domain-containing protein, partial [Gammaproteobacteria bacterium]|nr:helix-turn-helix domain-containing protein [Gammaproteobacteria bacterium]
LDDISTVYSHLSKSIEQGEILVNDVVKLDEQQISLIQNAFLETAAEEGRLKPVFDALDGLYNYEVLRCVRASIAV